MSSHEEDQSIRTLNNRLSGRLTEWGFILPVAPQRFALTYELQNENSLTDALDQVARIASTNFKSAQRIEPEIISIDGIKHLKVVFWVVEADKK
jgi:hypothetical protein